MKENTYYKKMDAIKNKAVNKLAMSKPVGKVLDSKVGKAGVKVGNKVIKAVKAPIAFHKKQWKKNQDFNNKNSTYEKFKQNSK